MKQSPLETHFAQQNILLVRPDDVYVLYMIRYVDQIYIYILNRGLPVHEFLAFQIAPSDKHNWLSMKEKLEAAKS